jgi:hypothetical protein
MKFKHKVLLIIGLCITLSIGSFFIIRFMFDSLENQLYEKCQIEAMLGSRVAGDVMEFMVTRGVVSETDFLDVKYIEIPKSNPKRYNTRYDRQIETYIQRIQDEFLRDVDIDFAVLIDKNGYVPVHNAKYSQAPTGNYRIDLVKSRSKRIFSDNPSIKKALEYAGNDTVRLLYYRDTGETMWLVGSPVTLRNNRWGFFLLGVSLQRIEVIKNQMTIITVTVMFMILSMALLAIIGIIPRKLLAADLDVEKY